jgi:hypothetical protein
MSLDVDGTVVSFRFRIAVVAASQVITRLNLTWEGHIPFASDSSHNRRSAFRTIVLIVVFEWVIDIC